MAVSKLSQAPYRQDRRVYPTPIIGDVLFSEVRDCTRIEIPEYGTSHPDSTKWPDHKLVFVKTVDIERDGIFEFFYAAERQNQDLYNFAFGNRMIGNREFRTVTRTYVTLRESFKPVDIEFGTPMLDIPEGKFDNVSYVFYDKEQQNTQQEELNSLFVIEAHSYVESAVLDEQLSLSVEKQDPLPPKFRVLAPTTTTEELAEGEVTAQVLTGDQLAVTEDQINTNLKRKRTVSRSSTQNIGSLVGKQVTNDLQVADVVETIVPDGTTIDATALTVDGSIEPLGNGQSVQRIITTPELFSAKTFSAQRPDPTPEKFRVLVPTESSEENIEGEVEAPVLTDGVLEVSEQQVNKFVKRRRVSQRDVTDLPKTLTQKSTTNDKLVAIIRETLQEGETSEVASATKEIQSEALGDGTYLVRTVELPEVFKSETFSVQSPDPTPEKFRVLLPTKTTEENIAGTAQMPDSLAEGVLEVTEQQVNKFVKRKRTSKRDTVGLPKTLTQKSTTNDKIVATVRETLQKGDTLEVASATKDVQSEAIGDGTYLVRTVEVPEVFKSEAFSVQRPDPTPEKFRVLLPTETVEENISGTAQMPTLTQGSIEATEQQVNKFVKRKRTSKRVTTALPKILTQKSTTNEKQTATVREVLQTGDTLEISSATKDVQSEALGDGTYLVRTVEVPEVFKSEAFSVQRPDPTPEKFRVLLPTETVEENISGTAQMPTLTQGSIEATEQQVNKFVKRKRTSKRDTSALPKTLTQKSTTNEKQVATVKEVLQTSDTLEVASATKDVQSEALGDGTYLVRTVEVPDLFESKAYTIQKTDLVPEKFRAQVTTITEQTNKEGQVSPPSLSDNELERNVQQINKFVYREQVTTRDLTDDVALPQVKRAYVEGAIVTIDEKLSESSDIETGLLVSESQATPIGDGKFVVQTVKAESWPALKSSEWDPVLNTQVQRTEQFVGPAASFTEPNTSYRAINKDRSLKITETEPTSALNSYVLSFPVQVDLKLPDVLKKIDVVWAEDVSIGKFDSEWSGNASGVVWSISGSESGSATSSITLKPELVIDVERPWGSDVTATAYSFFIKSSGNAISESAFLGRLGSFAGSVQRWPAFKPVSHTIVLKGIRGMVRANASSNGSESFNGSGLDTSTSWDNSSGEGEEYDINMVLNTVNIAPTIHETIAITNSAARTKTITASANASVGATFGFGANASSYITKSLTADITPTSLSATSPAKIPTTGKYVVKSNVEPYKWGWSKCFAIVVDASELNK